MVVRSRLVKSGRRGADGVLLFGEFRDAARCYAVLMSVVDEGRFVYPARHTHTAYSPQTQMGPPTPPLSVLDHLPDHRRPYRSIDQSALTHTQTQQNASFVRVTRCAGTFAVHCHDLLRCRAGWGHASGHAHRHRTRRGQRHRAATGWRRLREWLGQMRRCAVSHLRAASAVRKATRCQGERRRLHAR